MAWVLSFFKAVFKKILIALLFILVVLLLGAGASYSSNPIGIVNVGYLNLRSEPRIDKAPIKTLNKGDRFIILDSLSSGWLKIAYNGVIGYIKNQEGYISITDDSKKGPDADKKPDSSLETLKKDAKAIDEQLKKSESKLSTLSKNEMTLVNGLSEIEAVLYNVKKKADKIKAELAEAEAKMNETLKTTEKLKEYIARHKEYVSRRLVALYKLNRLGGMWHVLASSGSMYELFKRKTVFEQILDYDTKILENYTQDISRLNNLLKIQKKEKTKKQNLEDELQDQTRIMNAEIDKRAKLLAYIRSQTNLEYAVRESLKLAAEELTLKIESYGELKPVNISQDNKSAKSFSSLKGLLIMPVQGKIISSFGSFNNSRYNVVNFRSGIDIIAERGEPIKSVHSGRVLYSGWFRGYGNMIILGHGDHYYTVYANIEDIFKNNGETVQEGEVIATVGDSGSNTGPKLYFEIRHYKEPLNPMEWLKRS